MRIKFVLVTVAMALGSFAYTLASPRSSNPNILVARDANDAEHLRVEGEQRFRANCGRCHASPHKFPPRMMATIVRHMRVRATITEEDMRLVLYYMTQ